MRNLAIMLQTSLWYSGDPLFFFFWQTTHVAEFQCNRTRSSKDQYLDSLLRLECLLCFHVHNSFQCACITYMNLFFHLLYISRLLQSIALVEIDLKLHAISITFQSFKLNAHLLVCFVDNGIFTIFWWWFVPSLTHIGGGVGWPKKLCGFNWIYRFILAPF